MPNNLGNKQTMAKNIQYYMTLNSMERKDLAECIGEPYTTVTDWLNANTYPRINKIEKMAQVFGIAKADLIEAHRIVHEAPTVYERIVSMLPFVNAPVSAGSGQWLAEGFEFEFHEFEGAPDDADFALKVRGDSMSPNYNDDDIVFVKTCRHVESGQVGVFYYDGEGYMKMLQGNRLVSLNSGYPPIILNENFDFFVAGRVVGKAKP